MAQHQLKTAAQQALEALEDMLGWQSLAPQTIQEAAKGRAAALRAALAEPVQERNFCPRCGKRTNDIHTCTPPATLTDEVIAKLWHQNGGFHHHFARAIERWLKGNP